MAETLPKQRIFKPQSDTMNLMIQRCMEYHTLNRDIEPVNDNPSWTRYIEYLINKDINEIQRGFQRTANILRR